MNTSPVTEQIVYLNGEFLPMMEAQVSTQDRGFLFGDGVYEVIPVYQRQLFCFKEHLQRLKNSLQATSIANPLTDQDWLQLLNDLIERHPWQDQFIYLQVTRGVQMQRDHLPADCLQPTIYAYTNPLQPVSDAVLTNGIKAITLEDIRWMRCDIKAITLLPNIMMKLAAKAQGADDAILLSLDGYVNEGTASNVFIVKDGYLITPPNGKRLLPGVTRLVIERIAMNKQIPFKEAQISEQELHQADEIWLSSSTKEALPVTQLDGKKVGTGKPGAIWHTMRDHYQQTKIALLTECAD
ncbi:MULTISPECIES: D-amino acid aminotransferase [Thiomicrorhabdus]|uniref:D-amino acid aminotransferase n=1 Tax=Thiomicrorhabdus heinhorstiae TaxID=2748010 RepID=A0ABS0BV00_9GAMM|nr:MULTISPECIES: D-amino acid aminotransferase [Thiomicrorhabdus]MBF6057159.1 D-amino acid aminotransferase [Thiomicrorhabdus heinhorstiae]